MPRAKSITPSCRWPGEIFGRCPATAVARALATRGGPEAEHVEDAGLREANGRANREHAFQSGSVIVTKDEDFAARSAQALTTPVIVWRRIGNTTNRAPRTWIEPRLPGIAGLLAQGSRLVQVV